MLRSTLLVLSSGALVAFLSGCGGSAATPGTGDPPHGPSAGTAGLRVQTATLRVEVTDTLKFVPSAVTVRAGDVVEWDNTGVVGHDVTFDEPAADLSDPTLGEGDHWQVRFTRPGTYAYRCTIHRGQAGTVTVTGGTP